MRRRRCSRRGEADGARAGVPTPSGTAALRSGARFEAAPRAPRGWRLGNYAGICARAREGTAFPEDYTHYALSPGEAFAEAYRVLNDRRAGILGLTWSIVDDSFIPKDDTLRAVEHDVTAP